MNKLTRWGEFSLIHKMNDNRTWLVAAWHWKWSLTWRWSLTWQPYPGLTRPGFYWHSTYQGDGFTFGLKPGFLGIIYLQVQPNVKRKK